MTALSPQPCIDACNELLRGELSAVETYRQALTRPAPAPDRATLAYLHRQHVASANHLREFIEDLGGTACNETGPWGSFRDVVAGAAHMTGEGSIWAQLLVGEASALRHCQRIVQRPDLMDECADLIAGQLLPQQRRNLSTVAASRHSG